jgi:hypothetical protein
MQKEISEMQVLVGVEISLKLQKSQKWMVTGIVHTLMTQK